MRHLSESPIIREFIIAAKCDEDELDSAIDDVVEKALAGLNCPPVNLKSIATRLGVTSIETGRIPCDGALIPRKDGTYRVVLSKTSSASRRQFSLAHELGHAILHKYVPSTRSLSMRTVFYPPGHKEEERLCDMIAARLLMPTSTVKSFLHDSEIRLETIRKLSRKFRVSLSAAARRCHEISRRRYALLKLRTASDSTTVTKIWLDGVLTNFLYQKIRTTMRFVFPQDHLFVRSATSMNRHCGRDWIPVKPTLKRELFCEVERDSLNPKTPFLAIAYERGHEPSTLLSTS